MYEAHKDSWDMTEGELARREITFLKRECKVMLLWNKSEDLKNGSMGTFKKMVEGNKLLVYFEKVGIVAIQRVTWFQRNHQGETIGAVHQFPLTPGYAVTCHKS